MEIYSGVHVAMSGSGWSKFTKVAGLAALLIIGAFFTYALTIPVGRALDQEYTNRVNIHRQNAEDRIIRVCASSDAEPFCIDKTRQTQRENERAEENLGAQKVSAWWAQVMGVAALIGMGLSSVGVWLVWTTFNETRRANILSKTQQRGRIALNFESGIGSETGYLVIAVKARNIGHSVVMNCRASVHDSTEIPKRLSPVFTEGAIFTLASQADATLATYTRPDFLANGYYLFGVVNYDCIFGDPHETHFCVRIIPARAAPDHISSNLVTAIPCKPAHWPEDT